MRIRRIVAIKKTADLHCMNRRLKLRKMIRKKVSSKIKRKIKRARKRKNAIVFCFDDITYKIFLLA